MGKAEPPPEVVEALKAALAAVDAADVPPELREVAFAKAFDHVAGHLRFGDGVPGRRPPTGREDAAAGYRTGAGAAGNVDSPRRRRE